MIGFDYDEKLTYSTGERDEANPGIRHTYWNLVNPLSALVRPKDTGVRVPKPLRGFLSRFGMGGDTADRVAHALTSAAVIFAAIGTGRFIYNRLNPDNSIDLKKSLGYVKDEDLAGVTGAAAAKQKQQQASGAPLSKGASDRSDTQQALAIALPLVSAVVAAKLAGNAADALSMAELRRDAEDEHAAAVDGYRNAIRDRIMPKAKAGGSRLNKAAAGDAPAPGNGGKGGKGEEKGAEKGAYDKGVWNTTSLKAIAVGLTALAATAAGYLGYRYEDKANENNLMYKAYKKGLDEFARAKAQSNPIMMRLSDNPAEERRLFEAMDRARGISAPKDGRQAPAGGAARAEPEFDGRLNTPVSVTL